MQQMQPSKLYSHNLVLVQAPAWRPWQRHWQSQHLLALAGMVMDAALEVVCDFLGMELELEPAVAWDLELELELDLLVVHGFCCDDGGRIDYVDETIFVADDNPAQDLRHGKHRPHGVASLRYPWQFQTRLPCSYQLGTY